MNRIKKDARIVVGLLFVVLLVGCTPDVTISMDSLNPPSFRFRRNFSEVNTLPFFNVIEIAPENEDRSYQEQQFEKNRTLWRIEPENIKTAIDDLPLITYGRVPTGFIQKIPDNGDPPALTEGKVYEAGGPPAMMRRATVRFVIRSGRAVPLQTGVR